MAADLFGPKPRRKARRLMHVSDAGDCCTAEGGDAVIVQFKCARCRVAEASGKWCEGKCAAFSATPDRKQPQKTGEPKNRPTAPQTKKS